MVSDVKYCKITTCSHVIVKTYSHILEDYNLLIINEGYVGLPLFVNNELVINLDVAEEVVAKFEGRGLNKSMDSCFGVINSKTGQEEILLVEFKLRFTGFRNLRKEDMEGKVLGSLSILGSSLPINDQYIFVFDSGLKQQAIRKLFNMNPKIPVEYKAVDVYELKNLVF